MDSSAFFQFYLLIGALFEFIPMSQLLTGKNVKEVFFYLQVGNNFFGFQLINQSINSLYKLPMKSIRNQ